MQIVLVIPDGEEADRALTAFAASFGWQSTLADGSENPVTREDFLRERLGNYVRDVVRAHEVEQAAAVARKAVLEDGADVELSVT